MSRTQLTMLLVALALTACVTGGGGDQVVPSSYTLPVRAPTQSSGSGAKHHYPLVLRVAETTAPGWLARRSLYYQLLYRQDSQVHAYARSRWVQPPPAMLADALRDTLADTQAFRAVTGPDEGGVMTDLVLRTNLSAFVQRFTSPDQSAGILKAQATLVNLHTDKILSQRDFRYRAGAPSANAIGGVRALGEASGRFANAVAQWVQQTLSQCAPGCIKSAGSQ